MYDNPHKIVTSHLASLQIVLELLMVKRKALLLLPPIAPLSMIILIISLKGYVGIALSVQVLCLVPTELSVNLPAFGLMVLILVAAQGVHYSTYIVT